MATEALRDPDFEWLDVLQPTGLVVGCNTLRELGLIPERQTQVQSAEAGAHIEPDTDKPALKNPWGFVAAVLGWEAHHVAGSPAGPPLPENLLVRLPEHDTTLAPTWAVRELGTGDQPWQLLVRIETGIDPDKRGALAGWEASAHQRFERLLRETAVFAGLMIIDKEFRLVYAPRGETSGWLSFPIRALATVAGRVMLGGIKLLLDSVRLFTDADRRRLPALLKQSRDAQAAVSTALAEQVLGALHEMLRGLDAADPARIRELAKTRPDHLYEGLLTVLMRLVFVLYAEDRDLLPSRTDEQARELYENGYSVRGLYGKLTEDAALNPDTMDERRGGWGRLLALGRLIHKGHKSHFVQARGGKLFDPDVFPFLEGRVAPDDPPRVLPVSDGCILHVLEGLMTLKGPSGRERLSYRTLDVEQIGSVYETVMGFTVEAAPGRVLAIKAGKNNRTPVFVALERLVAVKGKERIKYLKEEADRSSLSAGAAKAVEAAKSIEDIIAALDPLVDERGSPRKHAAPTATPILQPTDERRRTGSHYTPRSLTEPIVRYALEPAFERLGPDATPEQIFDLKVCDPAMGSGAFLVEACRAIAARLVAAWVRWPAARPAIPADEDEDLHARRLVVQRCLYGVDKNPLATDLAKLSLWLTTLARDHEFTFLDHALKSGDSLVGLTRAQLAAVNWDATKPGLPLFRTLVADRVREVMRGRAEIQAAPEDTPRAIQEARHRNLEDRIKEVRIIGDAVIAAFFAEDRPRVRETKRADVENWLSVSPVAWNKLTATAATLKQGTRPAHAVSLGG
jgi:N-6 DNA Methylase